MVLNSSGTIGAIKLFISKAFNRVWHVGLLHRSKSYGLAVGVFGHISHFFNNIWLWVVLDGNSSQGYSVNAGVLKGSVLGPTLFMLYNIDLPDDVYKVAIYANDATVWYYQSDLRQQLELASELESDLCNTVDWGRKWLADFNNGKNQLVPFNQSNTSVTIVVKINGFLF